MLWSWGANSHGQLGLGIVNEQVETPTKVNIELYENKIKQIACGGAHTLLIDTEGKMFSCGWNSNNQLARHDEVYTLERTWKLSGISFTNIACGWNFSCGVTDDHFLFVWGSNSHGQLGLPRKEFPDNVKPIRLQVNACAVSMGLRHTAIINSKGEVWITGCGRHGQLGLDGRQVKDIALGSEHTICLATDNTLWAWGWNEHANTGIIQLDEDKYINTPMLVPLDIDTNVKITQIYAGGAHNFIVTEKHENNK